jgi:hypothetical protein
MGKKKHDWPAIVAAYKTSGQRQGEWCAQNSVNINNLRYWLRKEREIISSSEETCQWLPLAVGEIETTTQDQILTLKVGQIFIEIKPGFNLKFLTDVVRALISV